jgi:hypothetical protein
MTGRQYISRTNSLQKMPLGSTDQRVTHYRSASALRRYVREFGKGFAFVVIEHANPERPYALPVKVDVISNVEA